MVLENILFFVARYEMDHSAMDDLLVKPESISFTNFSSYKNCLSQCQCILNLAEQSLVTLNYSVPNYASLVITALCFLSSMGRSIYQRHRNYNKNCCYLIQHKSQCSPTYLAQGFTPVLLLEHLYQEQHYSKHHPPKPHIPNCLHVFSTSPFTC